MAVIKFLEFSATVELCQEITESVHRLMKVRVGINRCDHIGCGVLSAVLYSVFSVRTPAARSWSDAFIPLVNASVIDGDR